MRGVVWRVCIVQTPCLWRDSLCLPLQPLVPNAVIHTTRQECFARYKRPFPHEEKRTDKSVLLCGGDHIPIGSVMETRMLVILQRCCLKMALHVLCSVPIFPALYLFRSARQVRAVFVC